MKPTPTSPPSLLVVEQLDTEDIVDHPPSLIILAVLERRDLLVSPGKL